MRGANKSNRGKNKNRKNKRRKIIFFKRTRNKYEKSRTSENKK